MAYIQGHLVHSRRIVTIKPFTLKLQSHGGIYGFQSIAIIRITRDIATHSAIASGVDFINYGSAIANHAKKTALSVVKCRVLHQRKAVLYRPNDQHRELLRLEWLYFCIRIFVSVLEKVLPFVVERYEVLMELVFDDEIDLLPIRKADF
jgi:hypothetical protein